MEYKQVKCDIIIPIYNAYEALKECIRSVLKNTDLNYNQLILINDCSTDTRINDYIEQVKKENKNLNIVILNNNENLGFVGTVNRGMKYSKNDVLLLNSDTEVPKKWLDNIKKCAYSGEKIATVTPLSNNATLVSVPKKLTRNELPTDFSFEDYANLILKNSTCEYPELPVAHGFCMYIKRDVLSVVGYFDEKNFEKGYGEETDFCFRCLDYGYRHILCDNVIIYHKESQSFGKNRKRLVEQHEKIIENKYPLYQEKLRNWISNYPIEYILKFISYKIGLNETNRKNILIIIHEWENSIGGTTLHVRDIINNLREKFNFHVLYMVNGIYKLNSYFKNSSAEINLMSIEKRSIIPRYSEKYKEMLENIVSALNISEIHVHHMINHYFDIADVVKKHNINLTISLHDFYSICPTINMLMNGEKYCGDLKKKDCSNCLKLALNINNSILDDWHKDWERLFKYSNNIIVPSEDTKNRILKIYKNLNINVIGHGIDLERNYNKNNKKRLNKKTFNVAYVGVLANHKGLFEYKKIVNDSSNRNIRFHLFGTCEDKKMRKNTSNYFYHGKYDRKDIVKLLNENDIDLVCMFSTTPETFSYTVSEVIAAGIPILSYDIGAGAERIKNNCLGWTIPILSSIESIEKEIFGIKNNIEDYNSKLVNISKYKLKTISEMSTEYENIYKENKSGKINYEKLMDLIKLGYNNSVDNNKLEEILSSTKWKIISKINFSPRTTNIIRKILRRNR